MTRTRRTYTEAFKREALELWADSDKTGSKIEEELGIGAGCLYRWRSERRAAEGASPASTAAKRELRVAKSRIQELEREVAILEQEREILKKAVTIFVRPKPSASNSSKRTETLTR